MLRDLSKLIDDEDSDGGDGDQLQKELRQAAQQLWRAQFIYENDWGMKTSYEVLRRHMGYFENLFDALGYRVVGRPNDGYVGLVATDLPPRQSMKLDESLLLLVMRLYYEEAFTRFEAKEFGEVEVDSEQILQIYEDRTHRERPNFGRVKEILAGFRSTARLSPYRGPGRQELHVVPTARLADRGLEGHARFSRGVRLALRHSHG
jgi:hypothetical protein